MAFAYPASNRFAIVFAQGFRYTINMHMLLKNLFILTTTLLLITGLAPQSVKAQNKPRILVVDGRNNHDWKMTSEALIATLKATGRFEVDVSTTPNSEHKRPDGLGPDADKAAQAEYKRQEMEYRAKQKEYDKEVAAEFAKWKPDFSKYAAVVLNYNGPTWPEEVGKSFETYIKAGGGAALIHASNNAFRNWDEYNEMIGLGWRGADFGSCVKIDPETGKAVHGSGCGSSGHGSKHPFKITVRAPEHPVMKGIPKEWMHARDELYHHMRGPAKNMTVLSSAFSDPAQRGSGENEPMTWEVKYGAGSVIVTSMGHRWRNDKDATALHCVGFQTIFARSTEWVATRKVTLPIPESFPGAETPVIIEPSKLEWKK